MAIYNSVPPPPQQAAATTAATTGIDIEAWTLHSLQHLEITPLLQGTSSSPLHIPITDAPAPRVASKKPKPAVAAQPSPAHKRKDVAEKGKEGSRRRQRWENDRLLGVPGVQPPLPSDWEVHSTSPVRAVPYYLAGLWEGMEARGGVRDANGRAEEARVPWELRVRMKKAKAARGMLRVLEEEVRRFVEEWEQECKRQSEGEGEAGGEEAQTESSDEEIVFVGRDLSSRTLRLREEEAKEREREREERMERCVFEAGLEDRGAAFARYLVHALATYYGLGSWSVTVEDERRRRAFVGIKTMEEREMGKGLPRPLWGLV